MAGLVVLLPALCLGSAAALAYRAPRAVGHRAAWLVLLAAGLALASAVGLLFVTLRSPAHALGWELPGLAVTAPRLAIAFQVDALAALALCLVGLVALCAASRALDGVVGSEAMAGPLTVAAAAALFLTAAGLPLTLALSWLLLDLAVLMGGQGSRRSLLAGQVGLLCLLMGLLALPPGARFTDVAQLSYGESARLQFWFLLAAAVRMGLFPLWWAVPRTPPQSPWQGGLVRLSCLVGGAYLLLRAMQGARPGEALNLAAILPLALVLLVCGGLAWLASDATEALDWRMAAQGALVLVAIRPGGPMHTSVGLVLLLNLVLAGLVLYITSDIARRQGVIIARRVADAALVGLPLTLGFLGRWPLYERLLVVLPLVLLTIVVGTTLAARPRSATRLPFIPALGQHRAQEGLALALAVAVVVLGILPGLLAAPLGTIAVIGPPSALNTAAGSLVDSNSRGRGLFLLGLILVPPLAGELLRRAPLPGQAGRLSRRRNLGRAADLTGPARSLVRAVLHLGSLAQQASGMVEGRRARAWTLLAAIVAGVLVLAPPAPEAVAGLTGDPAAGLLMLAAAATGIALVLSGRPATTLAALAAGYILAGAILVAEANLWAVAAMVLVPGALIIGILALAEAQVPHGRSWALGAPRLVLATDDFASASRPLLFLALTVGLLVVYGVHSQSLPSLPDAVLQPALALALAGALTAATARAPLRLAAGVLLALAGFQLAFSLLDPGITLAAGLALFQLLFAVIMSYFVGLEASEEGPA